MKSAECLALVLACLSVATLGVQAQQRELQATSVVGQFQSLAYNPSVTGSDPLGNLPLNDSRLQRTVTGLAPEQVSAELH